MTRFKVNFKLKMAYTALCICISKIKLINNMSLKHNKCNDFPVACALLIRLIKHISMIS